MNLLKVPLYVKEKTEDNLVKEMIRTNVAHNITYQYFDIRKNGTHWYAWYLGDASKLIKRELKDGIEKNA